MPQHTTEATVVYTLNDLESWSYDGTSLAVLGHPIEHSISPPMQNAALAEMTRRDTRFANWRYFKFDITAGDLPKALSFLHAKKFLGLNLTVPHKVQVVDLVDTIDPTAQRMGAVNTLNWKPGGYHGCNTDGFGFEKALLEDLKAEITGSDIILLGAGGAARAIAAQCLHSGCRTLWIGNRNPERLRSLIEISLMEILGKSESPNCVRGFDLLDIPDDLPTMGILINATSLGLKTDDPAPLTLDQFDTELKVYDTIYNPAETALLAEARARGMIAANGLSMLVWQGARSLEIWSETEVPAEVMMDAARKALQEQ